MADLSLNAIRARYIAIHQSYGWGGSEECFDDDVARLDVRMLLELATVYRDLADWKQRYVLGTQAELTPTPELVDTLAH
ncbi:hypothetical protein GFS31_44500 (plasmid) [Leptolyngbya sp. BL0902]|uniref:hypothetical protein n=1 Tax=Leptolyngbya sp. BL0902 TaxID=1115757 RepID=UPI0018E71864|nr:hypothetical protein [Leptolyngbya sp. BL0902]QQE67737.1 hypothetical protein GFS31_44500 [Leptolyngbya sp. BL0902]